MRTFRRHACSSPEINTGSNSAARSVYTTWFGEVGSAVRRRHRRLTASDPDDIHVNVTACTNSDIHVNVTAGTNSDIHVNVGCSSRGCDGSLFSATRSMTIGRVAL